MCLDKPFKNHSGIRLMQNGAHTTFKLLQAHIVNVSPDLNPVEHTLDVIGRWLVDGALSV